MLRISIPVLESPHKEQNSARAVASSIGTGSIRKTNSFTNPQDQKNYQYAKEDKSKDSYFSMRHS